MQIPDLFQALSHEKKNPDHFKVWNLKMKFQTFFQTQGTLLQKFVEVGIIHLQNSQYGTRKYPTIQIYMKHISIYKAVTENILKINNKIWFAMT